jgi:hypothetical protein
MTNLWLLLAPALLLGGGAYLIWGKRTKKSGGSNQNNNAGTGNGTANAATSTKKPLWKIVLIWFVALNVIGGVIHLIRGCNKSNPAVIQTAPTTPPLAAPNAANYVVLKIGEAVTAKIPRGTSITIELPGTSFGHPEMMTTDGTEVLTGWSNGVKSGTWILMNPSNGPDTLEGRIVMKEDQPTR